MILKLKQFQVKSKMRKKLVRRKRNPSVCSVVVGYHLHNILVSESSRNETLLS